jgi:hypothetical protein
MNNDDQLVYAAVGPIVAIGLGVVLIPLRDLTVASNFTLAFLALTIVVGEFGGRIAALATAVVSAMSLDFFLTRPYMRLAIHDKNDLVAFLGLAGCGLLAASLGAPRRERDAVRRRVDLLHRALRQVESGGPAGSRVEQLAEAAVGSLPLSALFVRDDDGELVGGFGEKSLAVRTPGAVISPATLATEHPRDWRRRSAPLPADGLRLALVAGARPRGWLDL